MLSRLHRLDHRDMRIKGGICLFRTCIRAKIIYFDFLALHCRVNFERYEKSHS